MKPLWSTVLIARNEEHTLPRMLASLTEFMARGGEVIVLDTGSTDKTASVAKEMGAVVHEVGERFVTVVSEELANEINERFVVDGEEPIIKAGDRLFDFSGARNHAASLASNDWVAMPDCDEIYTKLEIDAINSILPNCQQLEYNFVFSHDQFGNEAIKFCHSKFYRRDVLSWKGIVHEVLQGNSVKWFLGEDIIKLEHYQNEKTNRSGYLTGLALDCFLDQNNDRNSHYLARELMYRNRPKSAIKEFERHISMNRWPAERGQSMIFIGDCSTDFSEKVSWYSRAFFTDTGRREPLIRLANLFLNEKNYQGAVVYAEACLTVPWTAYYANQRDHYEDEPHRILYIAYGWLGNIKKAREHILKALEYRPLRQDYLRDLHYYFTEPRVSIIIPTLGREEKLKRVLSLIKENAGYENYEVIVRHDQMPPNNTGVPKLVKQMTDESTGDLVMFLANDVEPRKDFLKIAVESMQEHFPEMDGLIGLNDCYWQGQFATHWLASKKLLPYLDGEFFHTGYLHCSCDNELTGRCKKIGKYFWEEKAVVYHDHPVQTGWDKTDEVYNLAYDKERLEHDRLLWEERRKLFDI